MKGKIVDINENSLDESCSSDENELQEIGAYTDAVAAQITQNYFDKIPFLNTNNLKNYGLSEKEFKDGVSSVSEFCGKVTALCSVGIPVEEVLNYLGNKELLEIKNKADIQLAEINSKCMVETAKYGMAASQAKEI